MPAGQRPRTASSEAATRPEDRRPVRQPGATRRSAILALLATEAPPHAGDALAERFGVSRQAIVHDIAVLRAEGAPIMATIRGYLLPPAGNRLPYRAVVAVRHTADQTEDELMALVGAGVRVTDVFVEHPVYGELRGPLHLGSPAEVRQWAASNRRSGVRFLLELTDGVHLHTIEATSQADLDEARRALSKRGYLLGPEAQP